MDDTIRELQRRAAGGGPVEQEALEQALARLGRDALRFKGPAEAPQAPHRGSRQIDRAESTVSDCWDWGCAPTTRNQASCRAWVKRRRRRAARRANKAASRDWELWE